MRCWRCCKRNEDNHRRNSRRIRRLLVPALGFPARAASLSGCGHTWSGPPRSGRRVEGRRRAMGGRPLLSIAAVGDGPVGAGGGATANGAAGVAGWAAASGAVGPGCTAVAVGSGGGGAACGSGGRGATGATGATGMPRPAGGPGSGVFSGFHRGTGGAGAGAARAERASAGGAAGGRSGPEGDRDGGRVVSALCRTSGLHRVSGLEVTGSEELRASNGQFGRSAPLKRGKGSVCRTPVPWPGVRSSALPFRAPE